MQLPHLISLIYLQVLVELICYIVLPPMIEIIIDHQSLLPFVTDNRKEVLKSINRKISFLEAYFFLTFYFYKQSYKLKYKAVCSSRKHAYIFTPLNPTFI